MNTQIPEASDMPIRLYMDLAKFGSILASSSLWFARADTFDDKWEAFSRSVPLSSKGTPTELAPEYRQMVRQHHDWLRKLRQQLFISCWTATEGESVAMWKIYGSYDKGVVIESTPKRFRQSLRGIEVDMLALRFGLVKYYMTRPEALFDYNKSVEYSWDAAGKVALQKRKCFAFEQEWRAVIPSGGRYRTRGVEVPVVLNELIEGIVVSPLASPRFLRTVSVLAGKFDVKATPLRSNLAQGPPRRKTPAPNAPDHKPRSTNSR